MGRYREPAEGDDGDLGDWHCLNIQGPGSVLDMCRNITFHSPTFLRSRELLGFLCLKEENLGT